MADVTIMSVVHQMPQMYYANVELTRLLNPDSNIRFLCCQNYENFGRAQMEGVEFMAGSETRLFQPKGLQISLSAGIDLNRMTRMAETRYVISLHHDFYCVQKGWIERVLEHMRANDLMFFGAPFNPAHYKKLLHFPVDHFFVIDTDKINRSAIDWRPHIQKRRTYNWHGSRIRKMYHLAAKLKQRQPLDFRFGPIQWDTGSMLYANYYGKAKTELLTPKYDWWREYPVKGFWGRFQQMLDVILPQKYSRRPKDYVMVPFSAYGFSPPPMETEEWYWKGYPFAFHFRLSKRYGFGLVKNDLQTVQIGMQEVSRYVMMLARMYEKKPWDFGDD